MQELTIPSPVGPLRLRADGDALVEIAFLHAEARGARREDRADSHAEARRARREDGADSHAEARGARRGDRADSHAGARGEDAGGSRILEVAAGQLEEYFAGARREFDLPLAAAGTPFQQAVWAALRLIPYGQTTSYADVASQIGQPAAVRAVGAANGRNPIPIVVPCHRVIGATGKLVGFGGGLRAKEFLLRLEQGALF